MGRAWTKIDIFTSSEGVEPLSSALSDLGHHSLSIVDAADFENLMDGKYGAWDYTDPELLKLRDAETTVTLYLSEDAQGHESLKAIQEMLSQLKATDLTRSFGRLDCSTSSIKDENWAESWKESYEPIPIGEKLIVCPTWIECDPGRRIMLRIDPGMAFGTGYNETTRMCLEALEKMVVEGNSVLDIGCGSGILSIAALLFGANSAFGIDIDEIAIKTAKENADINGVSTQSKFTCCTLTDVENETHDIVCANLSADVILSLMPELPIFLKHEGVLILSGIIKNREQDILNALLDVGFSILKHKEENGWLCIVLNIFKGNNH